MLIRTLFILILTMSVSLPGGASGACRCNHAPASPQGDSAPCCPRHEPSNAPCGSGGERLGCCCGPVLLAADPQAVSSAETIVSEAEPSEVTPISAALRASRSAPPLRAPRGSPIHVLLRALRW